MTKVTQAVIMVGGKGTRLRPLTDTTPKPILPVLDRPCLSYLIGSMVEGGIDHIILACGYRSEQMVEAIGNGSEYGITIEYSYEDEPLGTGGAIKLLEDRLDDTFVAANGDVFAKFKLKDEIETHIRSNADVTISLKAVDNPCDFGVARIDNEGRISEFKEKPKPEEVFSNLINSGVYVINKNVLKYVPDGFFDLSKELVPILIEKGHRIQGHMMEGIWIDVGRPSDLLRANMIMAEQHPSTVQNDSSIEGTFYFGNGSLISRTKISDSVILKDSIVADSNIKDSLIFSNCCVENSNITNSIIGRGTVIRSSTIRDAVIGDDLTIEGKEEDK